MVETLVGADIPQPAGVGADLVGEHDADVLLLPQAPELDAQVNQTDADPEEQAAQEIVDAQHQRHDLIKILRAGPAERRDMLLGDHGVVEFFVLVDELDDRARQRGAVLQAEASREGAGRHVAGDHLHRNHFDLTHQLLPHVESPNEVRWHADLAQPRHQVFGDPVVEDPLAGDQVSLVRRERTRLVLEILDERPRLGAFVQDFGPALEDLSASGHFGELDIGGSPGRVHL